MDAELLLLILKNVDKKILKEISLNNSYHIMEKLKGNTVTIMLIWRLKRLRNLKPKNKNEVNKMLG